MTDRYEQIRAALAMGPTPGPWYGVRHEGSRWTDIYPGDNRRCVTPIVYVPPCNFLGEDGISWKESSGETMANAKYVAACAPDTIRALLEERDALKAENERLRAAFGDIRREASLTLRVWSDASELADSLGVVYLQAGAALAEGS